MTTYSIDKRKTSIFSLLKQAIAGSHQDFTTGSIRKAVFLLAVPMILEMIMESVFAVVDIFFVSKLGNEAVATVGLTESVITLVYSVAIGLSMAATATVARRIGEKDPEAAAKAGMQSILLAVAVTIVVSILGFVFAPNILRTMGGSEQLIEHGVYYTRTIFGGSIVIMLLFLINGIFRGAGDASVAMRSLWIANICNIILCPMLINGWGPFPEMGLTGAAVATTVGRGIGVLYQVYRLFSGKGILKIRKVHFKPDLPLIKTLFGIAWTGTVQFLIASASWIVLARIIATFHEEAISGYQVAIRLIMFFLLPAWGLSNAAATLVGQNLGANQPQRAEDSVWKTAKYNAIFMLIVSGFFMLFAENVVSIMNITGAAHDYATQALRVITLGYIFYGIGMVMMNAFNGAGDTKTPTWINLFVFWAFQIPLAYILAIVVKMGPLGVFLAIVISETVLTVVTVIIFRKGKWKHIKV
jgi:putative MATE family efflux protein